MHDSEIIEQYQRAFSKYAKDGVIDMDNKLGVKFNFQVRRLANFMDAIKGVVPPNRQSQYFITFIDHGSGQKNIGQFTFSLHPNILFVIPQRVMHATWNVSPDYDGYVLSFNLDFFLQNEFPKQHIVRRKIFKCSIRPYITLHAAQAENVNRIFAFILEEHKRNNSDKDEIIAVKTLELLMLCDRYFAEAHALKPPSIYCAVNEKFNELVERHFRQHRTVAFYAKLLHLHPNYLNQKIKAHTGRTAKETIIYQIILEAKNMLATTALSVKEISFDLGFKHPEHFYSLFRKAEKVSPAQYRLDIR